MTQRKEMGQKGPKERMRILTTEGLFPWHKLPDSPGLLLLGQLLELLPDQELLRVLRDYRGHGRDDYPVHVLWRMHIARYILRHPSMESCLAEAERNPSLQRALGIEPGMKVPAAWNMSRFLEVLGRREHLELMERMFTGLTGRLGQMVEDLGVNLAGDSSALSARREGQKRQKQEAKALPQPKGGRKEYVDEDGQVVKVYEWFGYKFHLLVDVKHEVVLAFEVTSATDADCTVVPRLLEKLKGVVPEARSKTLAYDKAADDLAVHQQLAKAGIRPLIEIRNLWKDQTEMLLPEHDGNSNVVHDEAGTIYCYDTVSACPLKRKMSYIGYEKSRGTLKYRCPARHEGLPCASDQRCNGSSRYGKTVRVKCELDLRRFPPIPRGTMEFERRYKGRTSVERVNARLKLFWGADDGNVTGACRFHAHLYSIMLVHSGFANLLATAPRHEGRSLSPTRLCVLAQRLREATRQR